MCSSLCSVCSGHVDAARAYLRSLGTATAEGATVFGVEDDRVLQCEPLPNSFPPLVRPWGLRRV